MRRLGCLGGRHAEVVRNIPSISTYITSKYQGLKTQTSIKIQEKVTWDSNASHYNVPVFNSIRMKKSRELHVGSRETETQDAENRADIGRGSPDARTAGEDEAPGPRALSSETVIRRPTVCQGNGGRTGRREQRGGGRGREG